MLSCYFEFSIFYDVQTYFVFIEDGVHKMDDSSFHLLPVFSVIAILLACLADSSRKVSELDIQEVSVAVFSEI